MIQKYFFPLLFAIMVNKAGTISGQIRSEPKAFLAHTFSIVARDPVTCEMAVGVQSHWFAVGTIVSWGVSGVGVVATQSFVNPAYGPEGLQLMSGGVTAQEALKSLVDLDEGKEFRQVAFIDVHGNVATYTGRKCIRYASGKSGDNFSVQANMMLNDRVVPAMARAYTEGSGLPLAERVLKALWAAQDAGGDIRGKQSAALIVVGPERVEDPWLDKKIDLRVDDHPEPLKELERLLKVHRAYDHMNRGDLAVEHQDMEGALTEYGAAEELIPENLEMKFWKAVSLANNGRLQESLPAFRYVFDRDENWRELLRRLPESGLISVSGDEMDLILKL